MKMKKDHKIVGCDPEETRLLNAMADEARQYILSFRWAPRKFESKLVWGVGKVFAIFLFRFDQLIGGTDDQLWVVVGDLPSAYLVVEPNDSPREAAERYCEMMEQWCDAVAQKSDLSEVYPVKAAPTLANVDLLRRRIKFIRRDLISRIPNQTVG
jgi:hypothetical protein